MELNGYRIETTRRRGISLFPIGDIHAGSSACDERKVRGTVKRILDDPLAYWLFMGDACEFINYQDKRFDAKTCAPWLRLRDLNDIVQIQADWIIELFKPIREKCIGWHDGNHEETIRLKFGRDIAAYMAKALGAKYLSYSALTMLSVDDGKTSHCKVFSHHGIGGGRYDGAKINSLQMSGRWIDADLYLQGHNHSCISSVNPCLSIRMKHDDGEGVEWEEQDRAFVNTGTYFRTYYRDRNKASSSYAEKKAFPPSKIGTPEIHIGFDPLKISFKSPE